MFLQGNNLCCVHISTKTSYTPGSIIYSVLQSRNKIAKKSLKLHMKRNKKSSNLPLHDFCGLISLVKLFENDREGRCSVKQGDGICANVFRPA